AVVLAVAIALVFAIAIVLQEESGTYPKRLSCRRAMGMSQTTTLDLLRSGWIAREDSACMRPMPPVRRRRPSAWPPVFAWLSSTAAAQQAPATAPPPAAKPHDPVRFTVDVHAGITYRLQSGEGEEPGGALAGANFLIGSPKWLALGLGFDH